MLQKRRRKYRENVAASLLVPAQVQEARVQDDLPGREAAEEPPHARQPEEVPRLRHQRSGGEDHQDVLEGTGP